MLVRGVIMTVLYAAKDIAKFDKDYIQSLCKL